MKVFIRDHTNEVIAAKNAAVEAALEEIGMLCEGYAKVHLESNPRRIDTGNLRNSITHKMKGNNAVVVGSPVEYAKYVEYGTSKMAPNDYIRSSVRDHLQEYKAVLEEKLGK